MKLAQVAWTPGTQFSRYEIVSRLARGGMAEVWRAAVTGLAGFHREVVIKTMRPELAVSPDLVGMFINEARIAARLNHPGIMQVFDFGQLDSRYFIAMEYVPGKTLRQLARALRAKGRRLPRLFLLRLVTETARALGYGHNLTEDGAPLGFAHRDVSPENIMVSIDGTAKLIDFGAAVTRTCPPPPRTFVGKYRYLAPERLGGSEGDARSDVYSLGIVLYEYVTGRRPYDGPQIKNLILEGAAAEPCRVIPTLPRRLGGLISKAIAVEPANRFANGSEFAEELCVLLDRDLGDVPSAATEVEVLELLRDIRAGSDRLSLLEGETGGADGRPREDPAARSTAAMVGVGVAVVVSDPPDSEPEGDVEVSVNSLRSTSDETREVSRHSAEPPSSRPELESPRPRSGGRSGTDGGDESRKTSTPPPSGSGMENTTQHGKRVAAPDPYAIVRRSMPELSSPQERFGGASRESPRLEDARTPLPGPLSNPSTTRSAASSSPPAARQAGGAGTSAPSPQKQERKPQSPQESASSCFERGLALVAKQQFQAEVALWRRATALDPERRSYRINLLRLEKRIATLGPQLSKPPLVRNPSERS